MRSLEQRRSGSRLLCISPFFPPVANSEAFCGGKLVKALLETGMDISVLTCSNISGKRPSEDRSSFWSSLREVTIDVPIPPQKPFFRSLVLAAHHRTHFYPRWINALVRRAIELHAERKFDAVYSRSLPAVAHIAGYWCAKKLGLPWIVNMNDPWDSFMVPGREDEPSWLYAAVSAYWMRKTLRRANVVMYPSVRLCEFQQELSKISRPCTVLPHIGYSAPTIANESPSLKHRKFRLVHAGKLGSNEKPHRSADALLLGLSEFLKTNPDARQETEMTLVGLSDSETDAQISKLGLQSVVTTVGSVSYEESLRYIESASVCVLVEAGLSVGIFLPSKLIDYISARKPVLALSPNAGVVADLARAGGIVRLDTNDYMGTRDAIAELYSAFKQGILHTRVPTANCAAQFEPNVVAGQFMAAIAPLRLVESPERSSTLEAIAG